MHLDPRGWYHSYIATDGLNGFNQLAGTSHEVKRVTEDYFETVIDTVKSSVVSKLKPTFYF